MKTQVIKCISCEEYLADVSRRIKEHHTRGKNGRRFGGRVVMAKAYGISPQRFGNILNGYNRPSPEMLEADGLEEVRVFVRKRGGGE